jgi:hypothetical protein
MIWIQDTKLMSFVSLLLLSTLLVAACREPTPIGSGEFPEGRLALVFLYSEP